MFAALSRINRSLLFTTPNMFRGETLDNKRIPLDFKRLFGTSIERWVLLLVIAPFIQQGTCTEHGWTWQPRTGARTMAIYRDI